MWQSLPNLFAILATVSLGLSVIYDWAYLRWLGISFSEIPTTLSDHARSALVWLPSVGAALVAMLIFELITRRIEQGMTEQELVEKSKNPRITKLFRESPFILIEVSAMIGVVVYVLWAAIPIELFFFSSIIVWFLLSRWMFGHARVKERTHPALRVAVAFIPAIAIYFVYHGMRAAQVDLENNQDKVRIVRLTDGTSIEARILRSFEKVIILWEPKDKKLHLVTFSKLDAVDGAFPKYEFYGVLGKKTDGKGIPQEKAP